MTRRKKPPPQRKLQQITDSSGWTHVIKGPPGIINAQTTGIHLEHVKSTRSKYTLETYLDRVRKHYAPIWRGSNCFKSLSRIFEQDILRAENINITQCVCLGLGSMTAGSESSSYELAVLISILEILGTAARIQKCSIRYALPANPDLSTGKKHHIRDIIFQDPIFNSLDEAILKSFGYTVVETPDAFFKINNTTFLFAPHLECCHYATALENATPVLSIGSDLHMYVEG